MKKEDAFFGGVYLLLVFGAYQLINGFFTGFDIIDNIIDFVLAIIILFVLMLIWQIIVYLKHPKKYVQKNSWIVLFTGLIQNGFLDVTEKEKRRIINLFLEINIDPDLFMINLEILYNQNNFFNNLYGEGMGIAGYKIN